MFHKIKEIKLLKRYVLLATFQDGTVKMYDVGHLFDEIDLSCDELWDNGVSYEYQRECFFQLYVKWYHDIAISENMPDIMKPFLCNYFFFKTLMMR